MRKSHLAIACIVPLIAASVASAQSVTLFFGKQATGTACPATHPLANPTLYLAPQGQCSVLAQGGHFGTRPGYDTGSIDLWMNVGTNGGGGCGVNAISSLGLDIAAANVVDPLTGITGTNVLAAASNGLFISNTNGYSGTTQAPWSSPSPNTPTYNSGGNVVTDSRAVAVASAHSDPRFSGYCAGGAYHVGELKLTSGTQALDSAHPTAKWELRMKVGNLKITRVYDPSSTQGNATETVQFGAGDAATNGSAVGATSATADAIVIIRKKGDFGSKNISNVITNVPNGVVDGVVDANLFGLALGAACGTVNNYLGDFGSKNVSNVIVPVPNGVVDGVVDAALFGLALGS